MEARGRRNARVGARGRHVRTPTYRRGWCIAYYLCVVFVAALRAFFCSHRLLFISTNVQLYWSAIYHPHPAPPTPPMDFFPLFENVSGLYRGMEVCYDWPGVMEQPLMLHFVVPACHVILFCLLECRDWIFLRALCFCTLRRYCTVKIWRYLFFCMCRRFPAGERECRIHCCCFEPRGYGSTLALVYGYFELNDITQFLEIRERSFRLRLSFI